MGDFNSKSTKFGPLTIINNKVGQFHPPKYKKIRNLKPKLNKAIIESIHNDVMQAMAAKGKIVYDIAPDELDRLFETIAYNIKEKVTEHFKGIPPDVLKGHFEAIDGSIEDARERLKRELGLKGLNTPRTRLITENRTLSAARG